MWYWHNNKQILKIEQVQKNTFKGQLTNFKLGKQESKVHVNNNKQEKREDCPLQQNVEYQLVNIVGVLELENPTLLLTLLSFCNHHEKDWFR